MTPQDIELIREAADYMDYDVADTNVTDVTDKLREIADRMERELNAHMYQEKALNHVANTEPTPFIGAENQADGASLVWQPIETAPDETLVWLCEKGRGGLDWQHGVSR